FREALGEHLQRDGLAGAGRPRDEPVPVRELQGEVLVRPLMVARATDIDRAVLELAHASGHPSSRILAGYTGAIQVAPTRNRMNLERPAASIRTTPPAGAKRRAGVGACKARRHPSPGRGRCRRRRRMGWLPQKPPPGRAWGASTRPARGEGSRSRTPTSPRHI